MEQNNYLDIIEGMLYLAGDDGVDIKQVAKSNRTEFALAA